MAHAHVPWLIAKQNSAPAALRGAQREKARQFFGIAGPFLAPASAPVQPGAITAPFEMKQAPASAEA